MANGIVGIVVAAEKHIRRKYGNRVMNRFLKKLNGESCDLCFQRRCAAYCFSHNLGMCNICARQHQKQAHNKGTAGRKEW